MDRDIAILGIIEASDEPVKGTNFLVSSVLMLREQKRELEAKLKIMHEKIRVLEQQNAAFLDVSADRLLKRLG